MIQRIQTIYLLAVTILLILCMCFPVGTFLENNSISTFTNLCVTNDVGVSDYSPWAMFAILIISTLLSLSTIFMFKKRMLQIRLTIFNIILLVGYYATLITFIFILKGDNSSFSINWTVCLPLIAIILDWLAIRAIGKDEMLVKAYDRLR